MLVLGSWIYPSSSLNNCGNVFVTFAHGLVKDQSMFYHDSNVNYVHPPHPAAISIVIKHDKFSAFYVE